MIFLRKIIVWSVATFILKWSCCPRRRAKAVSLKKAINGSRMLLVPFSKIRLCFLRVHACIHLWQLCPFALLYCHSSTCKHFELEFVVLLEKTQRRLMPRRWRWQQLRSPTWWLKDRPTQLFPTSDNCHDLNTREEPALGPILDLSLRISNPGGKTPITLRLPFLPSSHDGGSAPQDYQGDAKTDASQ